MAGRRATSRIDRTEGRRLFGNRQQNYAAGRPEYPDWIYDRLVGTGVFAGPAATLEIGAGSGLASRRLMELGAAPLVMNEPDPGFTPTLQTLADRHGGPCAVATEPFETLDLTPGCFDLVAAATAFHWLAPVPALRRIHRLLRPGGTVALWWNVFQAAGISDPFHDASARLLASLARSPSDSPGAIPFALDRRARFAELLTAGFVDLRYEQSVWPLRLNADGVVALYRTFAAIGRLPEVRRRALLSQLRDLARRSFGGRVRRNMTTCLYLARRP